MLLGFQDHDIAPLIAANYSFRWGKLASNAPKYFAAVEIAERASDVDWLSNATKVVATHWVRKKQRKQLTAGWFV